MSLETTNLLLAGLSVPAREMLLKHTVAVNLPIHTELYTAESTPAFAYFITSGMVSIVTSMSDGQTAEVGMIGHEGLTGASHLLGQTKLPTDAFVQLDATALRVPFPELMHAFRTSEEIRDRVLEFHQSHAATVSQIAGCNRLHEVEERLARWLLMAQDRAQTDIMNFTQEFLGMMLGSKRTTVTVVAGALQRAGLIEYSRGKVRITNREGLEAEACDCYQITKRLFSDLYGSSR